MIPLGTPGGGNQSFVWDKNKCFNFSLLLILPLAAKAKFNPVILLVVLIIGVLCLGFVWGFLVHRKRQKYNVSGQEGQQMVEL